MYRSGMTGLGLMQARPAQAQRRGYAGLGGTDVGAQIKADVGGKIYSDFKNKASAGTVTKDVAKTAGATAAAIGGAVAGAAACAATGVGAAIAPFCGMAGAAIGAWVSKSLGPAIDSIGDAMSDVFDPNKSAAEAQRVRVAQGMDALQAWWAAQKSYGIAMDLLTDAVRALNVQHENLNLPGDYGWVAATQDMSRLGLPLQVRNVPGGEAASGNDQFTGAKLPGSYLIAPNHQPNPSEMMKYSPVQQAEISRATVAALGSWIPKIQAATAAVMGEFIAQKAALNVAYEVARQNQIAAEQLVAYVTAVKAKQAKDAVDLVTYATAVKAKQAQDANTKKWLFIGAAAIGGGYLFFRKK